MRAFYVPHVETGFLPRLCGHKKCLKSPASGSPFCLEHQQIKRNKPNEESENIYFIEATNAIKIGYSRNVKQRLSGISTDSPVEPVLLAVLKLSQDWEHRIQHVCKNERIRREWFRPEGVVLEILGMAKTLSPKEFMQEFYRRYGDLTAKIPAS